MHCEMRLRVAGLRVNAYYYQPSQCVSVAHYPDQHGTPSLLDTNTATKGRGEVLGATNACLQRARLSSGLAVAEVGSILDPRLVGAAQKHRRPIELEGGLRYAEVRRRGGARAEQQQGDNHGQSSQIKIKATHRSLADRTSPSSCARGEAAARLLPGQRRERGHFITERMICTASSSTRNAGCDCAPAATVIRRFS